MKSRSCCLEGLNGYTRPLSPAHEHLKGLLIAVGGEVGCCMIFNVQPGQIHLAEGTGRLRPSFILFMELAGQGTEEPN